MSWTRGALALLLAVLASLVLVSGGTRVDPRTPAALPGWPPPFLGTAVVGDGGLTAAVDAYGDVVDLRAGPADGALIENPSKRQAAGSVDPATGIVPRVSVDGGPSLPLWRADSVSQRHLPGTNVVQTVAGFGSATLVVIAAAAGRRVAIRLVARGRDATPSVEVNVADEVRCRYRRPHQGRLDLLCGVGRAVPDAVGTGPAGALLRAAAVADRRWLSRARPLGPDAPRWARQMYRRSLLVLRALTDRRSGAVAAGARDGWAYVWPRDAGAVALAFAAAGYRSEARLVARFLARLDLGAAARFDGDGDPVPGRAAQGDAAGWAIAAARAAGLRPITRPLPWRDRADYQEGAPGDFLANAIATAWGVSDLSGAYARVRSDTPGRAEVERRFGSEGGLARRAGDPGSGFDSAAAWAVRPFALPALAAAAGRTVRRLAAAGTRFGITPGQGWHGGEDPWSAPTAWTAWALAALAREGRGRDPDVARADRRAARRLLAALRRAATPAGALPERVDAGTGVPRSTTPLAWSHAFAALALLELWPDLSSSHGGEGGEVR